MDLQRAPRVHNAPSWLDTVLADQAIEARNFSCAHISRDNPGSWRFVNLLQSCKARIVVYVKDCLTGQVICAPPEHEKWLIRFKEGAGKVDKRKWVEIDNEYEPYEKTPRSSKQIKEAKKGEKEEDRNAAREVWQISQREGEALMKKVEGEFPMAGAAANAVLIERVAIAKAPTADDTMSKLVRDLSTARAQKERLDNLPLEKDRKVYHISGEKYTGSKGK